MGSLQCFAAPPPPLCHLMDQNVVTIRALWDEFTKGSEGVPPIDFLDAVYGAKWRPACLSKFYFGRKLIRDHIQKAIVAAEGETPNAREEAGILAVEAEMGSKSLSKIVEQLVPTSFDLVWVH